MSKKQEIREKDKAKGGREGEEEEGGKGREAAEQVKQKVGKKSKTSLGRLVVSLGSLADCGSELALFSFSTTIAISNHHHQRVFGNDLR